MRCVLKFGINASGRVDFFFGYLFLTLWFWGLGWEVFLECGLYLGFCIWFRC